MRERFTIGFAACIVIIFLPYVLTLMMTGITGGAGKTDSLSSISTGKTVSVERGGHYEVLDVEMYLKGVLPGIIDGDQEPEVWKALAVIERTNIYRQMGGNTTVDELDLVQEYLTEAEIRELWGERRYQKELAEVEEAILATVGQTITYDGEYITAYYHKVSDGTTVSAEELIGQAVPYLVSVDSSDDVESKDYMSMIPIPKDGLEPTVENTESNNADTGGETNNMAAEMNNEGTEEGTNNKDAGEKTVELAITQATAHGYVQEVSVNGIRVPVDDFCRSYAVPSYHFYIEDLGDEANAYRIVALGKGHGMGLSIYGAGVMSREGRNYQEILTYYYPGVQIR